VPGTGGKVLFTCLGMYGSVALPESKTVPGSDPGGRYLPAYQSGYYMHLGSGPRPDMPQKGQAPAKGLTIHKIGQDQPILRLAEVELPAGDEPFVKHDFTFDKRFVLIPQAKLLVVIPSSNDQLVLHRVDLEQAIDKKGNQ